jgi:hypothetical protein
MKKIILVLCCFTLFFPAISHAKITPLKLSLLTTSEIEEQIKKPQIKINIPGLNFSEPEVIKEGGTTFLVIPYLSEYIAQMYKYSVMLAGVVAVLIIIVGGFQFTISAGAADKKEAAKKRIGGALIGLLIATGSYTILYTINPDLVELKNLKIEYVGQKTISSIEGELTELYGGDPNNNINYAYETAEIIDGKYRSKMMAACGAKNGFSLSSYTERQDRLLEIVKVWKKVGVDDGGAVYIRGSNASCTRFYIDAGWVINVMANLYKKSPDVLNIPEGNCLSSVKKAASLDRTQRGAIGVPLANECAKGPDKPWFTEYKRLAADRANAAGLLCGDCASVMRTMLFTCFDNSNYTGNVNDLFNPYRPAGASYDPQKKKKVLKTCRPRGKVDDSKYVFQLSKPGPADIAKEISKLEFGDIIAWQNTGGGHVFMYTGKKGLGFEILEMGGGGRSDISADWGKLAREHAKIPWKISSMRVHRSAQSYLEQIAKKKDKCIFAFRPLK